MKIRLATLAVAVAVIAAGLVEAGGPRLVAPVDGADSWSTKELTWWVDYGLWKIKHSVSWQVKNDTNPICYTSWATGGGDNIGAVTSPSLSSGRNCYSRYSTYVPGIGFMSFKSLPIRNIILACWVAYSFAVDVRMDSCGILPSVWNGSGATLGIETIGSVHRACSVFDPFKVACVAFKSKLTFHGRGVQIWNSAL